MFYFHYHIDESSLLDIGFLPSSIALVLSFSLSTDCRKLHQVIGLSLRCGTFKVAARYLKLVNLRFIHHFLYAFSRQIEFYDFVFKIFQIHKICFVFVIFIVVLILGTSLDHFWYRFWIFYFKLWVKCQIITCTHCGSVSRSVKYIISTQNPTSIHVKHSSNVTM